MRYSFVQNPSKWGEEIIWVEGVAGLTGPFDAEETRSSGSSTRAADGTCMGTSLEPGFAGVRLDKQGPCRGRDVHEEEPSCRASRGSKSVRIGPHFGLLVGLGRLVSWMAFSRSRVGTC